MVLVVETLEPWAQVVVVEEAAHPIHITAKFLTSQVALITTVYLREALLPNLSRSNLTVLPRCEGRKIIINVPILNMLIFL